MGVDFLSGLEGSLSLRVMLLSLRRILSHSVRLFSIELQSCSVSGKTSVLSLALLVGYYLEVKRLLLFPDTDQYSNVPLYLLFLYILNLSVSLWLFDSISSLSLEARYPRLSKTFLSFTFLGVDQGEAVSYLDLKQDLFSTNSVGPSLGNISESLRPCVDFSLKPYMGVDNKINEREGLISTYSPKEQSGTLADEGIQKLVNDQAKAQNLKL